MFENVKYDEKDICFCLKCIVLYNVLWKYLLVLIGLKYIEIMFEEVRVKLFYIVCVIVNFMEVDFLLENVILLFVMKK